MALYFQEADERRIRRTERWRVQCKWQAALIWIVEREPSASRVWWVNSREKSSLCKLNVAPGSPQNQTRWTRLRFFSPPVLGMIIAVFNRKELGSLFQLHYWKYCATPKLTLSLLQTPFLASDITVVLVYSHTSPGLLKCISHCCSHHAGNGLVVLCRCWCHSVPVRVRKKTLALRRVLLLHFTPLNLFSSQSPLPCMSSAWITYLPKEAAVPLRRLPVGHWFNLTGELLQPKLSQTNNDAHLSIPCQMNVSVSRYSPGDARLFNHCLMCWCECVPWVHASPVLHP